MFPKNTKKKKIVEEDEDEIENTREYQVISNALGQDASEFNTKIEEQITILNKFRLQTNEITNLKISIKEEDDRLKRTDQSKSNYEQLPKENAQITLAANAAAAAPDDDGDDKKNASADLLIPKTNSVLKGLQYDGEINVNEIKQVEIYY
jgi:hypothetical protein